MNSIKVGSKVFMRLKDVEREKTNGWSQGHKICTVSYLEGKHLRVEENDYSWLVSNFTELDITKPWWTSVNSVQELDDLCYFLRIENYDGVRFAVESGHNIVTNTTIDGEICVDHLFWVDTMSWVHHTCKELNVVFKREVTVESAYIGESEHDREVKQMISDLEKKIAELKESLK